MACLVGPKARMVADEVVSQVQYDHVPSHDDVVEFCQFSTDDTGWLEGLPLGPGISPCVNRTCARLLEISQNRDEGEEIDELLFLETLCATAVQLSRLVRQHQVNVPAMITQVRENKD